MKVSVIVTTSTDNRYLEDALRSLRRQNVRGLEVIVVDNGLSADVSARIAEYCRRHPEFRCLPAPGASKATQRNAGIVAAQGKYIAFLNSKDCYTPNYLRHMVDVAQRHNAQLTVGRMRSFNILGTHAFSSTDALSLRTLTNRFDTMLIWNPSVCNKLFLRGRLLDENLRFAEVGSAQEALFSLRFALTSDVIACAARGFAEFRLSAFQANLGNEDSLQNYLYAYAQIREQAKQAFDTAIARSSTAFSRQELQEERVLYLDEIYLKVLTILIYRFPRRFYDYDVAMRARAKETIATLMDSLSSSGRSTLLKQHADLFVKQELVTDQAVLASQPRVSILLYGTRTREELQTQLDSIYGQTMPFFELLVARELQPMFPEDRMFPGQVQFLDAASPEEYKQLALETAKADYLMLLGSPSLLDLKVLQWHYTTLERNPKAGFSTSPLSQYDGQRVTEYRSMTLAFYQNSNATRVSDSPAFALDLFLCNKLFRVSHLKGIHFSFSDNRTLDAYKIYRNASFCKILQNGVYLPNSEAELLSELRQSEPLLPHACRTYYRTHRMKYWRNVTLRTGLQRNIAFAKSCKRFMLDHINHAFQWFFRKLPLKNQVLFYTIRSNGKLAGNLACLYDAVPENKKIVAYPYPHPLWRKPMLYYHLMTSKIIVTDDYIRYIRAFRLRKDQRLFQVWHACGAFKRFALDAPLPRTRLEEMKTHSQYHLVTVSSEHCRQYYAHAFGIPESVVQPLGVPRTDVLLDPMQRSQLRQAIYRRHPVLQDKTIYLFCPTFREDNGAPIPYDPRIDWKQLNAQLNPNEFFIIKKHPIMQESYIKGKHYMHLRDYSKEDTQALLAICDVLITDYSSVFLDACLLGIPSVFYCPDLEEYERSFYLQFPEDLPGPVIQQSSALLPALRQAATQSESEKQRAFTQLQLGACDGNATQRCATIISDWARELF